MDLSVFKKSTLVIGYRVLLSLGMFPRLQYPTYIVFGYSETLVIVLAKNMCPQRYHYIQLTKIYNVVVIREVTKISSKKLEKVIKGFQGRWTKDSVVGLKAYVWFGHGIPSCVVE